MASRRTGSITPARKVGWNGTNDCGEFVGIIDRRHIGLAAADCDRTAWLRPFRVGGRDDAAISWCAKRGAPAPGRCACLVRVPHYKTMTVQKFRCDHPPEFDRENGTEQTRVLALQMVGKPGEHRRNAQIIAALGPPHNLQSIVVDLEQVTLCLMRPMRRHVVA